MTPIIAAGFILALITGGVAKYRGSSFVIWFLVGFFLPGLGLIGAFLVRSDKLDPRRECDNCGAILPITAQVCMRCGEDLEYPEELIAPRGYSFEE